MARRLRLYSHPLTSRVNPSRAASELQGSIGSSTANSFVRYIPRNVSPISHIIIPQTTGLDPNAHLTPLKGYQIRFKGKILEKTLRSNLFKFRTGHTRKSDYRSHHFQEGYSVHGPFGTVGIRVYYEYDLEPYFGSNEIYSEEKDPNKQTNLDDTNNNSNYNDIMNDIPYYDEYEDEETQQLLLEAESDL